MTTALGKRIKIALGNESPYAFSKRSGIPYSLLRRYISGDVEPRSDKLMKIATSSGVELDWLVSGKGATPNVVHVEPHVFTQHAMNRMLQVELPKEVLSLYGIAPGDAALFVAEDETMAPAVERGDTVLINSGGDRNVTKGMQVIATPDRVLIRNVRTDTEGMIHLSSLSGEAETIAFHDMPAKGVMFYGVVAAVLKRPADLQLSAKTSSKK